MENESDELKTDQATSLILDFETNLVTPEDALLCLTGGIEVNLPMPNVRACNNLDEYLMKSTNSARKRNASNNTQHSDTSSDKSFLPTFSREPFAVPLERNFDKILKKPKHGDGPASSSLLHLIERPKRLKPDVFSRIDKLDKISGPLHLLKVRLQKTIKVLIRRRRKAPYISRVIEYKGILTMFDKHMNLYLKDVIESFKYALDDKILKRARHRDNILLRGDNIILISCEQAIND